MGRGDGSSSSDAGDADYDDAMSTASSSGAEASSYSGYEEEEEELSSAESTPASSSGAAEMSSGYEEAAGELSAAADSAGEKGEDGIQAAEQARVRDEVVEEGTGDGGEDGIQAATSAGMDDDDGGGDDDEWVPSTDDDASGEEDYAEVPRSRRSPDGGGDELVGGGEEEHPAPQFTEGDDAAVAAGEEDDDIINDESQDTRELRKIKKKKIQDILDAQNASIDADMNRGKGQLEYLLKQTELFAYFSARSKSADDISRGRSCRSRGRHGSKLTEEEEDTEYLKEEEDALAGAGATLTRLVSQPSCIKGNMREYQLAGLNWLIQLYENGINGILADEMGLGKTLQTISLLGYLHEFKGITGPHMIVAPKSTLGNWINEIQRFCPILRAVKLLGNTDERNHIKEELLVPGRFDVCVTSFEMVIKEKTALMRFTWRYIIIDEAHRIKNENSILSKTMRLYKTNYRLLITGTPLQNNLHELWSLLNFLLPEIFSSAQTFDEWFQISGENDQHEVIQKLHKVLRPFLLRRLKSNVEKGLPPKTETILKVGMSHMQKQYYCATLQKDLGAISSGGECKILLNIAMQLRKCCNHPYLFQGAELGPPYTTGDHLIENSGKMVLLDKLLAKLKEHGSRVLIFSQMTRLLDILEDYLEYREYQYCLIDGNTGVEDRDASIEAFNTLGSQKFIFLLSTRAGCLGINLATANVVILYDSDWNPQVDLQAQDRAHRIGQKKDVQVFRFCIEHTIEEKIIERAYKKLALDALVIQQGRLAEHKAVSKDELLEMVRFGAELVFSSNDSTLTDEDIDHIIANGEKATAELDSKMKKFTEDAIRFKIDKTAELYNFDGDKDQNNIGFRKFAINNSIEPLRRERKSHNYCEDDYFRKAFGEDAPSKLRKTRTPRMMQMHDFQFINTQRLNELYEKEAKYNVKSKKKNDTVGKSAIEDCPEPLTAEEQLEKQKLLEEGFPNWTKKDFHTFLKACEKHGRNDLNNIAFEMKKVGIKEEEVQRYAAVFNKRFMELKDYERIIKNIEKGEARVVQKERIMKVIERKMVQYKDPPSELIIQYGQNRTKSSYSKECDRFMLCMVHKLGYGNWNELRLAIRMSPLFKHDWFIKSRSAEELGKRCDTLIRLVEKELAHERIDQSTLLAQKRPHPDTPTIDRSGLSSFKRMRDALPNQSPGRR